MDPLLQGRGREGKRCFSLFECSVHLQALQKKVESLQAELARARNRPMMRTMEGTAERPAPIGASSGVEANGFGASPPAGEAPEGEGSRTKSWSLTDMLDPDYVVGGGLTPGGSSSGGLLGECCSVKVM